jgi:hypothetical protein
MSYVCCGRSTAIVYGWTVDIICLENRLQRRHTKL